MKTTRLELAHDLLHRAAKIKNRCGSPEVLKENPSLHSKACVDVAKWIADTYHELHPATPEPRTTEILGPGPAADLARLVENAVGKEMKEFSSKVDRAFREIDDLRKRYESHHHGGGNK